MQEKTMSQTYKTEENLKSAFAGESQAYQRYILFAVKADTDGHSQSARLFRAAAAAEAVHARNHLEAMDAIGSTRDNLLAATIGEHYEFTRVYPTFIAVAEEEQNARAENSFRLAIEVEQVHHRLFEAALRAVESGKPLAAEPVFVCQVCGNTVSGGAADKCPVCGSAQSFRSVE
jgi:rubrerythrin